MNNLQLIGNLTDDPDIRHSQSGSTDTVVARYRLAVQRRYADKNGERVADFIPCVAFGKSAEFAEKWFRKGTKIAIVGRLQSGSYTDKEGKKVYTLDVVVEQQEFAGGKPQSTDASEAAPAQAAPVSNQVAQAAPAASPQPQPQQTTFAADNIDDDDLPW